MRDIERPVSLSQVYISNIAQDTTKAEILTLFARWGTVLFMEIAWTPERVIGLIRMANVKQANLVVQECDGVVLNGLAIRVQRAERGTPLYARPTSAKKLITYEKLPDARPLDEETIAYLHLMEKIGAIVGTDSLFEMFHDVSQIWEKERSLGSQKTRIAILQEVARKKLSAATFRNLFGHSQ